jgi:hypothetical protein
VRIVLAAGAALAVVLAVVGAMVWLGDDDSAEVADVRLAGESEVEGVALLEQDGDRMTGYVVVWGLEPNTEHAVHFHGPDSRCGAKADPVAVHPDLRADANGVASTKIELEAEDDLLAGGFYYNVHEGPSRRADNPEIACGDIAAAGATAASG